MSGKTIRLGLRVALAAALSVVMFGCGESPITSTRIEAAIARTFANLVEVQVSRLGLAPTKATDFAVTAMCRKQTAGSNAGAGDWICRLVWRSPDRQTINSTYDLSVTTDGCYTATVDGESLGGPTLKASDGSVVRNLVYTFEGCFDTT
jgi:hypothetical protein